MKLLENVKKNLRDMKENTRRFPLTLILSLLLGLGLVAVVEYGSRGEYSESIYQALDRMNMTLFLASLISLATGLFLELLEEKKSLGYILYLVELAALYIYYKYILVDLNFITRSRYIGFVVLAILAIFFIGRINNKKNHDLYVSGIIRAGFVAFINFIVLFLGLAFIIFTLNSLFGLKIRSNLYFDIFIILLTTFFSLMFTAKLPSYKEDYEGETISQVLERLLAYIVIPLIFIYTSILYVFFLKIIVTRTWPQGLVAHLVLWYSIIGMASLFFTRSIVSRHKIVGYFRRLHPLVNIPTIVLLFMAIYMRVSQHGFTSNRYFVLAGGIWILVMDIYYILVKEEKNILVVMTLFLTVLVALVGPVNNFIVSERSQARRLKEILVDNQLYKDQALVKAENIDFKTKVEISNKLDYLNKFYGLEGLDFLPKDFSLDRLEDFLGFKFNPNYYYTDEAPDYYSYYRDIDEDILELRDYNYLLNHSFWEERSLKIDSLSLEFKKDYSLDIRLGDRLETLDFKEVFSDYNLVKMKESKDEIIYEYELEDRRLKFIVKSMQGEVDGDSFKLNNLDIDLLIK